MAAKHQVELFLSHFRNVYQVNDLIQIQKAYSTKEELPSGFVKFHNILQDVRGVDDSSTRSLLEEKMINYTSSY